MIAEAQRTLDDDERLAIYSELQEVLYEEAMWVMPAQEAQPAAYGEWVKNYVINPMWPRPAQRWALYDK
jgi:ABC-type transport system substrate-binding protein